MKSQNKKWLAALVLLLFLPISFVQAMEAVPVLYDESEEALDLSDYAYFREIQGETKSDYAMIELDEDVYNNSNFADLKVLDNTGKEIPVKLMQKDLKNITKEVQIVDLKEGMENMLDENKKTLFKLQEDQVDKFWKAYKTSVIFDLGEEKELRVIDFITESFVTKCKLIEASSSVDGVNYEIVKPVSNAKDAIEQVLYFNDLTTRYLKIDFGYADILPIVDIAFYTRANSKLVFEYDASKTYTLYYGNFQADKEILKNNFSVVDVPLLTLGKQQENPNYNADIDGDGILNFEDNCPLDANPDQKDSDGDGMGDVCDTTKFMSNKDAIDWDMDGIGNTTDNCVYVKNVDQKDSDGDGIGDMCEDDDGDMILAFEDNCVAVANNDQADENGNGIGDVCEGDADGDGVDDVFDNCLNSANPNQKDSDGDGVGDVCDNCPNHVNPDQKDLDGNGVGDVCEDSDGDGILDYQDNCPNHANPDQKDSDGDGVGDVCDNCPNVKNSSQWDDDNDGVGNECEDSDGDGILDYQDNCPNHANPDQKDSNNDGVGDVCEDFDGDGIIDLADNCPNQANADQKDSNNDGIGDACDFKNLQTKKPPYIFYGLLGMIGLAILYYAVQLVKQINQRDNLSE